MTKIILPPIGHKLVDGSGQVVKEWYDKFKFLEQLQPLSDIPSTTQVDSIDTATGDFTLGYGLSRSSQQLKAAFTSSSAVLSGDVSLNNTGTYFDGPSVAQGSTGTWFVTGTVCLTDTLAGVVIIHCKLWDGTTIVSTASIRNQVANFVSAVTLSGVITSPAGNLRISCIDVSATSGKILFNASGNSKDSHITAVRIA